MKALSRDAIQSAIITVAVWLSLVRATNMGFAYPTSEYQLASIDYLPQKMMQILVLMLLALFAFFDGWHFLKRCRVKGKFGALFAFSILSCLLSQNPLLTFRFLLSVIVVSLPFYLYLQEKGGEYLYCVIRNFLALVVIVNIIYCLLYPQYAVMSANHEGAWRGMFVHKNNFGGVMALTSVVFYAELFDLDSKKSRAFSLTLFFFCCFLTLLSLSTSALIVLGSSIVSFHAVAALKRARTLMQRVGAATLFLSLLISLQLLVHFYLAEILLLFGKEPTLTGRTELWDTFTRLTMQQPWIGYGIGLFSRPEIMYQYSAEFGWAAKSTHSSYFDLLLGVGIPATILFVFTLFNSIGPLIFDEKVEKVGVIPVSTLCAVVCGILVYAISGSNAFISPSFIWVLLISLVLISRYVLDHKSKVAAPRLRGSHFRAVNL